MWQVRRRLLARGPGAYHHETFRCGHMIDCYARDSFAPVMNYDVVIQGCLAYRLKFQEVSERDRDQGDFDKPHK